jgi:hypothetical protein
MRDGRRLSRRTPQLTTRAEESETVLPVSVSVNERAEAAEPTDCTCGRCAALRRREAQRLDASPRRAGGTRAIRRPRGGSSGWLWARSTAAEPDEASSTSPSAASNLSARRTVLTDPSGGALPSNRAAMVYAGSQRSSSADCSSSSERTKRWTCPNPLLMRAARRRPDQMRASKPRVRSRAHLHRKASGRG